MPWGVDTPTHLRKQSPLSVLANQPIKMHFSKKEEKSFSTFLSSRKENNVNWRMKDAGEHPSVRISGQCSYVWLRRAIASHHEEQGRNFTSYPASITRVTIPSP